MRVFVLPLPGGARIWRTSNGDVTAACCASLRPERIVAIENMIYNEGVGVVRDVSRPCRKRGAVAYSRDPGVRLDLQVGSDRE